jgi:hypothetical protein
MKGHQFFGPYNPFAVPIICVKEEIMKIFCGIIAFAALAMLGFTASPASADSIGGTGSSCGTCQGATYTLNYALESSTATTQTYDITYTIDTSTYTGGGSNIDSAAIKVSSSVLGTTVLDSAPGGTSKWTVINGGIDAGGCDGSGSGFECASASPTAVGSFDAVGGTLAWVFDVTVPTGGLITSAFGASIKARYVNSSDAKVGDLVSEDITAQPGAPPPPPPPVPEPMSLLLFGSGFAMFLAKKGLRKA